MTQNIIWSRFDIWSRFGHVTHQARSIFLSSCCISNALYNHVTRFCSQIKCAQYWPSEGTEQYGDIEVTATDWIEFANYTITTFQICKVNKNDLLACWMWNKLDHECFFVLGRKDLKFAFLMLIH